MLLKIYLAYLDFITIKKSYLYYCNAKKKCKVFIHYCIKIMLYGINNL